MKGEQSFVTQPTALSNTTQPAMQMTQTGGDGLVQYQLGADSTATVESARNTFASVDLHPGNSDGIVLSKPNSTKRVTVNSYNGHMFISYLSCREMMPDPDFYHQCINRSLQEHMEAARAVSKPKPAPKTRAKARKKPKTRAKRAARPGN